MKRILGLGLLALLLATPLRAQDGAQKLLECMRANVPDSLRIQQAELTVYDRAGGSRSLKGRLYALRESVPGGGKPLLRAMLRIEAPEDMAGAAYLIRQAQNYLDDGTYVYLPSVRRVRRVTGTFADGSLLGTDFTYYEFKQLAGAFGDLKPTLEGPGTVAGRAVQTLAFSALPEARTRYTSVRAHVDQKTCVPLQVEFHEGPTLRKQLSVAPDTLQQSGRQWFAGELEMRDLKDGTRTLLRVTQVSSNGKLPSRLFDPNAFYLGN